MRARVLTDIAAAHHVAILRFQVKVLQRNIPPPRFLFMDLNKRCNLRCQHCDYWQQRDDDRHNYLSAARQRQILTEFSAMNPTGCLVVCGGEPMLSLEEYFELVGAGRSSGLRVLSVVNGTQIRSSEMAERMISRGPHEISISLNSHRQQLHDQTRGVRGAFDKAVRALRLLIDARHRLGAHDARIYVMGLVHGGNYRELEAFYDFVLNDVGADKLKLNFLQPTFGQQSDTDSFFAVHGDVDPEQVAATIRDCDERHNLGINDAWLQQVQAYFRTLRAMPDRKKGWAATTGTDRQICNSYHRNIMIDHYGVARLCFSTAFPGKALEHPGDLKAFWHHSGALRSRMRRCRQLCGISHSVRAQSSTLEGMQKWTTHVARFGPFAPAGPVADLVHRIRSVMG